MQYHLEAISQAQETLEISEAEFVEISAAKRGLVTAIGFEEKLYVLLENYAEFERELLNLNLRRLVFADNGWSTFQDDILAVNRRLANLLTAARLYLDQVDHDLASTFGDESPAVQAVRTARNNEYDRRLSYRTMEAIRNYLQHRSFPIHHLSFGMERDEAKGQVFAAHTICPSISLAEIRRDGRLKTAVLEELTSEGDLVPVTPLVREYVEALGRVHESVRVAAEERVAAWEATVTTTIARARTVCGDSKIGFLAVARSEDTEEQEIQLFSDLIDRRQFLQRRSSHAAVLAKHYVSGKTTERDA